MATQDARHFLNGMFLEVSKNKLTVVATDGHRLSMSSANTENPADDPVSCIIPRKCITEIKRILTTFKDNKENYSGISRSQSVKLSLKLMVLLLKANSLRGTTQTIKKCFLNHYHTNSQPTNKT